MPAMPRINNKMKKIAYDILGLPANMKKTGTIKNQKEQKPLLDYPLIEGTNKLEGNPQNADVQDDRGWTRQQWIPNISGPKKYGPAER